MSRSGGMGNRQYLHVDRTGYSVTTGIPVLSAPQNQQIMLHSVFCYNGSASSMDLGIGISRNDEAWDLFTLGASDVDETDSIQAGSPVTIFTTTNNDGFLVQSSAKFDLVTFNITQAQTGAPVFIYEYWDGSAWQALDLTLTPDYSSVGKTQLGFQFPLDWNVGDGTEGGFDTLYSVRALATNAPTQAVIIDQMYVVKILAYRGTISAKQHLGIMFKTREFLLNQGESVMPIFSVADANNTVEIGYQLNL